ncbi:nuclease-related domain-containing protein [Mammaliicoccus vitulinus]|uniref:nuclease-related domain-containing protein n=2 Tax=Mammaliicoccus vitulinus TaxID=71237 RepID=UPI001ED8F230|nr:nuclease-related domain-containing protein [Mammaliicoccus vitulinus]
MDKKTGGRYMEPITYFQAIDNRIEEHETTKEIYTQLKGEEGERIVKSILDQGLKLNYEYNLRLDIKNKVQIDFLVVDDEKMINLEIKHYHGDYYIVDNQMKNSYGNIFPTPFQQMRRAEYELEMMKSKLHINREIESYLIFTNPTFTIHTEIPNRNQVLLPTELHKIPKLFKNYKTHENKSILNKIKTLQQDFSQIYPKSLIPFAKITPGLRCPHCRKVGHINIDERMRHGQCMYCSTTTTRQSLYLENLKELYVLKNEPFTLKEAEAWCGGNRYAINTLKKKVVIHFIIIYDSSID